MPLRILIADDNAVFRTALRTVLQSVDHWEIIEAADGQEAISKAVESLPDLIVVDLAMPVKDGFAAAREISQLLPQTPIVMCTMHMSPQVDAEALKSGIRKVLSKADSALLIATLKQFLPGQATPALPANLPLPVSDPVASLPVPPAVPDTQTEAAPEPPEAPLPKNVA